MKAFKKEIYWQCDHERKVTLYVFIDEILAKMTQVSDMAPGPLVYLSNIDRRFPINVKLFSTATYSILGLLLTWYEVLNHVVYDRPSKFYNVSRSESILYE
jgi:hypothetical protein